MPPRQTNDLTNLSSPLFVGKVTADLGSGEYSFVEVWQVGIGWATKTGGRYGTADNPGVAMAGLSFDVDDYVLVRSADAKAGTSWELVGRVSPVFTVSGTDNRVVRMDGADAIQDSAAELDDDGNLSTPGNVHAGPGIEGVTIGQFDDFGTLRSYLKIVSPTPTPHGYTILATDTPAHHLRLELADSAPVFYLATASPLGGVPAFGIHDRPAATYRPGLTGALTPGCVACGGIVTDLGTGAPFGDAVLSAAQTFTAAQTLAPSTDTVPLTIQGVLGQTANLFLVENSAGTDLLTVSPAGLLTAASFAGDGAALTNLSASNVTTGTLDCGSW